MTKKEFQKLVFAYYQAYGRHDLPWRQTTNPYHILVSEIMLQQTQVDRVKPKYEAFIKAFPSWKALAQAQVSQVLTLWQGLGYNRRAINLKKAAEEVTQKYKGKIPENVEELVELSGIGPYTAGAIRAFAFNKPGVFIETNIRSVFIYTFFPKARSVSDKKLFVLIDEMQDKKNPREWYWALMDYGAFLKKKYGNVNTKSKHYTKQSKFEGSDRQVRGEILKYMITQSKPVLVDEVYVAVSRPKEKIQEKISELIKEGFILQKKELLFLA